MVAVVVDSADFVVVVVVAGRKIVVVEESVVEHLDVVVVRFVAFAAYLRQFGQDLVVVVRLGLSCALHLGTPCLAVLALDLDLADQASDQLCLVVQALDHGLADQVA